jgi:hypothetical protein
VINTLAWPSVAVVLAAATTFSGAVDGGGSVTFSVSDDHTQITTIQVNAPNIECGPLVLAFVGNAPIANNAFSYTDSGATFAGSFPTPQTARGTVQLTRQSFPACTGAPAAWTASAPGAPAPTPAPTATPMPTAAPADLVPPEVALAGSRSQRAGRTVAVRVTSNEPGSATATGAALIRRSRRTTTRFALRSADAQLQPNTATRLELRVTATARRSIAKALRRHQRVRAALAVTVRDAAGNSTRATRTVRLRRR